MNVMDSPSMSAASAKVASALSSLGAKPKVAGDSSSTSSTASGSGSTITSDDFLTLLVSELKNQDPTQPTDPGAYIQQLVGVNSLQQLIQINQGLSAIESTDTSATSSVAASSTLAS